MKSAIKKNLRTYLKKRKTTLFHQGHQKRALSILKHIENEKGKTDPKHLVLSREYSNDVFRSTIYAPWLYVYSAVSGKFEEGWIPANYYAHVVTPKLKGNYADICDRNIITNSLLNVHNSLDLFYYVNKLIWDVNNKIVDKKNLKKILFESQDKVVYKIENSKQGIGIHFFTKENFRFDIVEKLGDGVFQKYIFQHPFFEDFTTFSVATIRVTTSCDEQGNISVNAAYLRIGQKNDTHVKSASAIKVPIDLKSGQLLKVGYYPNWSSTHVHPENNVSFDGKVIPEFQNCLSEVVRMHKSVPFVRCIGWDIIVDKNNLVRLIEWNGQKNDIIFSEATQGPCFKHLQWENLN